MPASGGSALDKSEPGQASLGDIPDPEPTQPSPEAPLRSRPGVRDRLMELRGWFSRRWATRRGRDVLAGSAVAATTAAALAILFVAGVFTNTNGPSLPRPRATSSAITPRLTPRSAAR